jgi:ubiquinone/menaquinone biosynthesis C-methylase UbiE
MITEWDYSTLAASYLKRPQYSEAAVSSMLSISSITENSKVCDIGAGVGHLTKLIAQTGSKVIAIEPNLEMFRLGKIETLELKNIFWEMGTGEKTNQQSKSFNLVTFGSSFNVCDREVALLESSRILKVDGWFACLWNHRELSDPLQKEIESIIHEEIQDYSYGTRRESQTQVIEKSGLFKSVIELTGTTLRSQTLQDFEISWASHATLARQAGKKFELILNKIKTIAEAKLNSSGEKFLSTPYKTVVWMAQKK